MFDLSNFTRRNFGYEIVATSACLFILNCSGPSVQKTAAPVTRSVLGHESNTWPVYSGDSGASKYSDLNQINQSNINRLKVAWFWHSPDYAIKHQFESEMRPIHLSSFEGTPIMVDGSLYVSTSLSQVAAIDAHTGRQKWVFDTGSWRSGTPPNFGFLHRGVALWQNQQGKKIIYIGTGDARLIALNADTGEPVDSFGKHGQIIIGTRPFAPREDPVPFPFGISSPPTICRDTIVVGTNISDPIADIVPPIRGDIGGFDVKTGRLKWIFHTIPLKQEFGAQTWEHDSEKIGGGANVWAPMSVDQKAGILYLPVGSASNDHYGGLRPGDDLFSDSLLAVDCETGKRIWHYQIVHHDLWDYDLPASPILYNTTINGSPVQAVAQITKQGFVFVFDRISGQPIWPIEERPVPQSDVPGEKTAATQPFPTKPPAFEHQGISEDQLIDFTPEIKSAAMAALKPYRFGPLYFPPSLGVGTLGLPGQGGGANWNGAAYSPRTGYLYIPSFTFPASYALLNVNGASAKNGRLGIFSSALQYVTNPDIDLKSLRPNGLPLFRPPFGRLTAIDLDKGEIAWVRPLGKGPKEQLKKLGVTDSDDDLGWDTRSFVLATPDLIWAAQSGKIEMNRVKYKGYTILRFSIEKRNPSIWAFDPVDGRKLFELELPMNASGGLMTYEIAGKQFIVVPIGGGNDDGGLVALTLN